MRGPGPSRGHITIMDKGSLITNRSSATPFLSHASGFLVVFFLSMWLRVRALAIRSHPPGIPASHHRPVRFCFCRGHPRALSRHAGPYLPHSWFRLPAFRHASHRLQPALLSISPGSAHSLATGLPFPGGLAASFSDCFWSSRCSWNIFFRAPAVRAWRLRGPCSPSSASLISSLPRCAVSLPRPLRTRSLSSPIPSSCFPLEFFSSRWSGFAAACRSKTPPSTALSIPPPG